MKIAIIGAGNVGRALATSSVRAGHSVVITASDAVHAQEAAEATGALAASSNRDAVAAADVVVLAVWYAKVDEVLEEVGDLLPGKVLVDTTNPVQPDLSALLFEGPSAAERIQAHAPGARVVKAFNTVFASRQADPFVDGTPVDALIAADDEDARATVSQLAESIGFRAVDACPLSFARGLEWLGLINMTVQIRSHGSWQGGWKLIEPRRAALAAAA